VLDFESGDKRIVEIVLTGGSCAGKTTALTLLAQSLREKGHDVLTVPEAASMLITAGVPDIGGVSKHDLERGCVLQEQIYVVQRALRRSYRGLAQLFYSDTVVILYDRGELDGIAYHGHDDCVRGFARSEGTTLEAIRDGYSAVMHLVTTADGAEHVYTLSNNPARWDSVEEACTYDQRVYRLWQDHPRHYVIDNSTDFIGKMRRLGNHVLEVIATTPAEPSVALMGSVAPVKAPI
jgi:AAA domain